MSKRREGNLSNGSVYRGFERPERDLKARALKQIEIEQCFKASARQLAERVDRLE